MKNTVRTRWKDQEHWLSLILCNATTSTRNTSLLPLEFEEQEQDDDASMTAASNHARVEAGVFILSWSSSCCHRHDRNTRSRLPYAISRCPVRFKAPKRSLPRPAASGWQPVLCMTGKLLHAARTHSSPRSRFCQLFTHTTDVSTDALVSTSCVESNLPRFNSTTYFTTLQYTVRKPLRLLSHLRGRVQPRHTYILSTSPVPGGASSSHGQVQEANHLLTRAAWLGFARMAFVTVLLRVLAGLGFLLGLSCLDNPKPSLNPKPRFVSMCLRLRGFRSPGFGFRFSAKVQSDLVLRLYCAVFSIEGLEVFWILGS